MAHRGLGHKIAGDSKRVATVTAFDGVDHISCQLSADKAIVFVQDGCLSLNFCSRNAEVWLLYPIHLVCRARVND